MRRIVHAWHENQWSRVWGPKQDGVVPIVILDEFALRQRRLTGQRAEWRKRRDAVLAAWAPGGPFAFTVRERKPVPFASGIDQFGAPSDFVYGAVRVCRGDGRATVSYLDEDGQYVDAEHNPYLTAGILTCGRNYDNSYNRPWPTLMMTFSHEMGHVLGLRHRSMRDRSPMSAWRGIYPDAHDLEAIRSMYPDA